MKRLPWIVVAPCATLGGAPDGSSYGSEPFRLDHDLRTADAVERLPALLNHVGEALRRRDR